MNKDIFHVLESMIKDNDDGFVCDEIIEPYVNANREKELSEQEIFSILHRMLKEGLISHYMCKESQYALFSGNICSDSWFTTTRKGKKEYSQSVEQLAHCSQLTLT
jgi:DNA-binding PadR family transcriptional regulator